MFEYQLRNVVGICISICSFLGCMNMAGAQSCPGVFMPNVTNITPESALVKWNSNPPEGSYYVLRVKRISETPHTYPLIETYEKEYLLEQLIPGSLYEVDVKTICPNNESNFSNKKAFLTPFLNDGICESGIKLRDNICLSDIHDTIPILIEDMPDKIMGENLELLELRLLIRHTFPSDLVLKLRSPSGKTVLLSERRGSSLDDYGNFDAPNCTEPFVFSALACNPVATEHVQFRGQLMPEGDFTDFNDGSSPEGLWKLIICDGAMQDIGTLEYVQLVFSDDACIPSLNTYIQRVDGQSVDIAIVSPSFCQQTILEIVPEGSQPGTNGSPGAPDNLIFELGCNENEIQVTGLLPATTYSVYSRTMCAPNLYSFNDCGTSFTTICNIAAIQTGFDEEEECAALCDTYCTLEGIWKNDEVYPFQWVVGQASTPTDFTGPSGDAYGLGKYIYLESSDPECILSGPAELISECLEIGGGESECFMQFSYHLYGADIGTLTLFLTLDDGTTWDTLFTASGDHGNKWHIAQIDLAAYSGKIVQLRFQGTANGPSGDMALDEIIFFNDIQVPEESFIYFADKDGDGYGDPLDSIEICFTSPPPGYVINNMDCDDTNPNINPDATEIPCNLIDDNCSGEIDDVENNLRITQVHITDATCVGMSDGSIQPEISGGEPPFLIEVFNEKGEIVDREQLKAGYYRIVVEDTFECITIEDSVFVFAPEIINVFPTDIVPSGCEGLANGEIQLTFTGGAMPYEVIWEDSSTELFRNDLSDGNYAITVTDANGCTTHFEGIVIPTSSTISISLLDFKHPTCYNKADGQIRIRPNDDNIEFSYSWSHDEELEAPTARLLGEGKYTVTITSSTGCSTTRTYTLTAPDSIQLKITALDHVSCPGGSNGLIQIEPEGGTPGYTYIWSDGSIQRFTKNLFNIKAGNYHITVIDQNNCNFQQGPIIVSEPPEFKIDSLDRVDNRCLLSQHGALKPYVSGGTPDYLYFWSNGEQESQITGLANGIYLLTITDHLGCKQVFPSFNVISLNQTIESDIILSQPNLCYGDETGKLIVSVNSGLGPYDFHWSTGKRLVTNNSIDSLSQLKTGDYKLTITDAEGCTTILNNLAVGGPVQNLSYLIEEIRQVRCFNDSNGMIQIKPEGGTSPYHLTWNAENLTGTQITNLASGNYQFTLTDANQCTRTSQVLILNNPEPLVANIQIFDELCEEGLGQIYVNLSGGEPPYDVRWFIDQDTIYGVSQSELSCGTYSISGIDFRGCRVDTLIYLGPTSIDNLNTNTAQWRAYPNPFNQHIFLESTGKYNHQIKSIHLINTFGQNIGLLQRGQPDDYKVNLPNDLPAGIYFIQIINTSGELFTIRLVKNP